MNPMMTDVNASRGGVGKIEENVMEIDRETDRNQPGDGATASRNKAKHRSGLSPANSGSVKTDKSGGSRASNSSVKRKKLLQVELEAAQTLFEIDSEQAERRRKLVKIKLDFEKAVI